MHDLHISEEGEEGRIEKVCGVCKVRRRMKCLYMTVCMYVKGKGEGRRISMTEKERKKEFAIRLMEFYEKFLGGMADSIEYLAELQEKYREEYEEFKQAQIDLNKLPQLLDELDKLDPELKNAFVNLIVRVGLVSSKLMSAIVIEPDEKRSLANELRKIIASFKTILDKMGGGNK
jgi:Asp-tRNA(Asn)/Glu-tRNA(Gln) amidotransferase C subunit